MIADSDRVDAETSQKVRILLNQTPSNRSEEDLLAEVNAAEQELNNLKGKTGSGQIGERNMTITIALSDNIAATLIAQAQTVGRPVVELAAEAVAERFTADSDEEEFPLDAEAIESIRRGFADIDASRTVSWAEARANLDAAFMARYGTTSSARLSVTTN